MGKNLSKKQLQVLQDLFVSDLSEKEVLDKHKISCARYSRWHSNPLFAEEYEKRRAILNRWTILLVAKNASKAAESLVSLTKSERPETARRACLDIIGMLGINKQKTPSAKSSQSDKETGEFQFVPELAGKILKILAEENSVRMEKQQLNKINPISTISAI